MGSGTSYQRRIWRQRSVAEAVRKMTMAATLQGIRGTFFGLEIHGVEAELVDAATGHGGGGRRGATRSRDGGRQLRSDTSEERAEGGARERGGSEGRRRASPGADQVEGGKQEVEGNARARATLPLCLLAGGRRRLCPRWAEPL